MQNDQAGEIATARPVRPDQVGADPARAWALRHFFARSAAFEREFLHPGRAHAPGWIALHALGNGLQLAALGANDVCVFGDRTVGVVFLENTAIDEAAIAGTRHYDAIIAGSSWNAGILRASGVQNVKLVLQGIDPALFFPGPRAGLFGDRFAIFSGGKLEYRKGQDIVVQAFRRFHTRHPDSILVTAWQGPWSAELGKALARHVLMPEPSVRADGSVNVTDWLVRNGIPAQAVVELGSLPNAAMPLILREIDAGVFPSRCEGGTNLVAMEAMAVGVPCVISKNTGHLDLIEDDNCLCLTRQKLVSGFLDWDTEDWGDSEPDEIVEHLEKIYTDRAAARVYGHRGAMTLKRLSWPRQIDTLFHSLP